MSLIFNTEHFAVVKNINLVLCIGCACTLDMHSWWIVYI